MVSARFALLAAAAGALLLALAFATTAVHAFFADENEKSLAAAAARAQPEPRPPVDAPSKRSLTDAERQLLTPEFLDKLSLAVTAVEGLHPAAGMTRRNDKEYAQRIPELCTELGALVQPVLRLSAALSGTHGDNHHLAQQMTAIPDVPDAEQRADVLGKLATAMHKAGPIVAEKCRHDFGRELLSEALAVRRSVLGEVDELVAETTVDLALAMLTEGAQQRENAAHLLEHAVQIYRKLLLQRRIAQVGSDSGDNAGVMPRTAEQQLELTRAVNRLRSELAVTLTHLASLLCESGRAHDGVPLLDEAVAIQSALLEEVDAAHTAAASAEGDAASSSIVPPPVDGFLVRLDFVQHAADVLSQAVAGYSSARAYDKAMQASKQAVQLRRAMLGDEADRAVWNPIYRRDLADALMTQAGLYSTLGDNEASLMHLREAVGLRRALLPAHMHDSEDALPLDKDFADLLHSFGITLGALGHTAEGERVQAEAAAIWQRIHQRAVQRMRPPEEQPAAAEEQPPTRQPDHIVHAELSLGGKAGDL